MSTNYFGGTLVLWQTQIDDILLLKDHASLVSIELLVFAGRDKLISVTEVSDSCICMYLMHVLCASFMMYGTLKIAISP